MIVGEEFATLRLACTSLNQGISGNPIAGAQSISFPTFPDAAQIETPSVPRILHENDSYYDISEHLFDQPAQRGIAARRTLIGLWNTGYCGERKDTADAVLEGPARAGWSSWSCSG